MGPRRSSRKDWRCTEKNEEGLKHWSRTCFSSITSTNQIMVGKRDLIAGTSFPGTGSAQTGGSLVSDFSVH